MYRKINKGRSIVKILIYSVILTWFTNILLENWRSMRLSWFKEVWDFVDFKAIGLYIEDHLGIYVVFSAGFVTVYKVVSMFARAGRFEGDRSEHFEEPGDISAEYLAKLRAKWEDDFINNRHRTKKHEDEDT